MKYLLTPATPLLRVGDKETLNVFPPNPVHWVPKRHCTVLQDSTASSLNPRHDTGTLQCMPTHLAAPAEHSGALNHQCPAGVCGFSGACTGCTLWLYLGFGPGMPVAIVGKKTPDKVLVHKGNLVSALF